MMPTRHLRLLVLRRAFHFYASVWDALRLSFFLEQQYVGENNIFDSIREKKENRRANYNIVKCSCLR